MRARRTEDGADEPIVQTVKEPLQQILKQQTGGGIASAPGTERTLPFRPVNRQPLARLTILDDGNRQKGEILRVRESRVVIGRERGQVTIPFDNDISGEHAELRCQKREGRFQWYLLDLGSTNGTFLRAYRASLSDNSELLLGSRRYAFQLPQRAKNDDGGDGDSLETHRYEAPGGTLLEQFLPRLTEVGAKAEGRSFSLRKSGLIIGRDSRCDLVVVDDPLASPQHARFYQDERSRWMIEDRKSLNGVWIRVRRIPLSHAAEFQLGQQRFRFQPE